MMKIKTSKRLLCALLTVLLVLPTLLAGTLLTASAASVTYTVASASSGSISYIGKNYTTGASNQSLSFELNSGFTMSGSDGSTWYATCIYAGRADPPIGTQFSERYGIGTTTFTDGLLQGPEKGPHYVVNASSSVSPSATNYDPMVGYGREVSASFVFSCWYWAYQYQNRYSGVTFDNNLLQEAVAIAYRYEYDTRLIKYGNTFHKWADWQQKDGRSTYWQQTPYSQWRTDTNHFSRATSNASIVDAANAILDAAMSSPVSPSTDSDGTMTYTGSDGTEYEMFALSGPSRSGSSQPYQDLLLFRAKENPPQPTKYAIRIYKYPEGAEHDRLNTKQTLAGAKFKLEQWVNGRWVDTGKSLTTYGGNAMVSYNNFSNLEAGKYRVIETKAPDGYDLDSTPHEVTLPDDVNYHNDNTAYVILYLDNPESKPNTGAIDVLKHDSSGRPIEGVRFELYMDENKIAPTAMSATTGPSGIVTFTGLTPGTTYWVFETAAPDGYAFDPNKGYSAKVVANTTTRVNNGDAIVNHPDTVTWTPKANKHLTGRWLQDDEFTFVLEEFTNGAWKTLQTVKNREDSIIPFTWVRYGKSDVGEHKYQIRELEGDDPTITYDSHVISYTVEVTFDEQNQKLTATQTRVSGDTTFNNIYEASWTPEVTKELTGRKLKDGEFTFILKEDGRTLQTVKNDPDGNVPFAPINYTVENVGTHTYTVEEQKGSDPTIKYDSHTVTFTVEVAILNGQDLTATQTRVSGETTFDNTYSEPKTGAIDVLKHDSSGRPIEGVTFELFLDEDKVAATGRSATTGPDGIATFTDLTPGETYWVFEIKAPAGYAFDPNKGYSAKVVANTTTRVNNGNAIVNYPTPTETGAIDVLKHDSLGRPIEGVTFELYLDEDAVAATGSRATTGPDGIATFTGLTPGETYWVFETKAPAGYAFDPNKGYSATVVANTTTRVNNGDAIVNYPDTVTWMPHISKRLTGRWMEDDEFTFVLEEFVDDTWKTLQTVKNREDGVVPFTWVEYRKSDVGEHKYQIRELEGDDPTISYDSHVVSYTVEVAFDGQKLTATEKSVSGDTTFKNTYTEPVDPTGSWKPKVTKELTGRDLEDGEFTFVLKDSEGHTLQTVTNRADGSIPFTAIHYTKSDVGEHIYTVEEQKGSDPTITYDSRKVTFTVTVSYSGSGTELTVTESVSGSTTFKNTYTEPVEPTGSWTPDVTKELTGRDLEDGEFTFVLKDSEGHTLQTVTNRADGSIPFTAIHYTKSDVGEHIYTVEEQKGSDPTITYDSRKVTFTVTVSYSGSGTLLSVSYSYMGGSTFKNTYTKPEEPTGSWTPTVTKELTGRALSYGEFTFVLEEGGRELQRKSNLANGSIPFEAIHYTKTDVGTHTYTIREIPGSDSDISYDGHTVTFTVTVSYSGSGMDLTVEESVSGNTTFKNTYTKPEEPTGSWTPTVTKELTGRNLKDGEFTFVLEENGREVWRVQNNADGRIPFGTFFYTKESVGEHTYTIYEVSGSDPTITYDSHKVTFTVTVSYSGSGTVLTVSESVSGDTTFTNTYTEPEAEWTPDVFKRYNLALSGGDFEFILEEDGVGELQRKSNLADGSIPFEAIHYTSADIGTHYYTIREVAGADPLIDYDADPIEFTVVVSDDGSGGLTVSATRTTSVDYFYNTYTEPEGKWEPEVTKELIGRPLSYGEFTFVLEEDGTELQRVQNNADGSIPFTALHYTLADVGYHTYTIREISGSDSTVLYDEHVVTFDVTVEDSGRTLTVMWLTHGETTFTNYALTATWTPHASKTLVGRPLQDGEFTFVLKDSSGTVLQTKSNHADGSVVFDPLVFTLADVGTHTYTVEEKDGGDATILYDGHVVTFTVTVSYTDGDADMSVSENVSESTTFTNYVAVRLEIEKTDLNGNTLAGAEFLLEWSDDDGLTWHNVFYAATVTKGGCSTTGIVDGTVTTGRDGKITFENLYPTLRYRLTETKAPDGMQLLTDSAFEGTLPSPEGETNLSLRVVNVEALALPPTGGHGFWNAALAVPLLCVSIGLLIGGVRKNKKKYEN